MTAAQQIRWKQQTVNVHYLMFIAGHSLLRFSPCYKIVADIQSDGRGTKAQGYHSLTKKVRVVLSAIYYNGRYYQQLAISGRCTLLLNQIFKRERILINA